MATIYRFYNSRSSGHEQSAGAVQEDDDEGVVDIALAEGNPVADNQEGAAMALNCLLVALCTPVQFASHLCLVLGTTKHTFVDRAIH